MSLLGHILVRIVVSGCLSVCLWVVVILAFVEIKHVAN